jgi:F-type H+-transporting ATPase subunit delta
MTVSILGRRYGQALLTLATQANKVDKIGADLKDFAASWQASKDLRAAFENPTVNAETRRTVLRELAAASGMDDLARNTLLLVADRGRIAFVPEIAEGYAALAEARSGRVRAEVVSAIELPDAYFSELQKTLERVTGKQVSIAKRVDPTLLGGVVARVGDNVFDGSLKHRLEGLTHELSR